MAIGTPSPPPPPNKPLVERSTLDPVQTVFQWISTLDAAVRAIVTAFATAHAVILGGPATAAPGAAGQVLTSNGPSADPSFQPPVATRTLLNTLTANNSATLSDTTSLTNAYSAYEIEFENLVPVTNGVTLELQVHSGGAFKATGYLTSLASNNGTSVAAQGSGTTTFIQCSQANGVPSASGSSGISGTMKATNPSNASAVALFGGQSTHLNSASTVLISNTFGGVWNTAAAVDGFQLLFSSGNIASGTVKIYGLS